MTVDEVALETLRLRSDGDECPRTNSHIHRYRQPTNTKAKASAWLGEGAARGDDVAWQRQETSKVNHDERFQPIRYYS